MGNTDRRGPEISDGWQGTSDDGSGADMSTGGASRVAVIGAGVAGLGTSMEAFGFRIVLSHFVPPRPSFESGVLLL